MLRFISEIILHDEFIRKRTLDNMRPAKIQFSLHIHAIWSESSLGAFWTAKDTRFLNTMNEDFDQTAGMRMLISVFVVRTCQQVYWSFSTFEW